jgi:membrane protease YdiL (CAAX protease family)
LTLAAFNSPDGRGDDESKEAYENRNLLGVKERKYALGLQMFQSAGGLSAYHSFRTAVRTRQQIGQFGFLREEESVTDILLAPFDMRFLTRPTTLIPLAVGGALYYLIAERHSQFNKDLEGRKLEESDVFFASAFSYNAGTHEEAVFRGWVQPMFYHITGGKSVWTNVITSGIFAAAHLPSNPLPLPQFALSLHLGWVTERNQWTLAESVFIHTWWDVIAFLAQYQVMLKEGSGSQIEPALHLPPLEFHF